MVTDVFCADTDIPFTQFLRPDGRRRDVWVTRPAPVVAQARVILAADGRFEIEELIDGTVSMTVEHPAYKERDEPVPVAIRLCPNGQDVPGAVDALVAEAHSRLARDGAL